VSLHRGIDGSDPVRPDPVGRLAGTHEERRATRSWVMATGTLACPACDAPVAPAGPLSPADLISCPFCAAGGRVRDFLSLEAPSRPARVQVRVLAPQTLSARR
jgi:hypothetical protein